MRWLALLALLAACSFEHGALGPVPDGPVDTIDGFVPTWAIDTESKRATPASPSEWQQLTTAKGLSIGAPQSLWSMQEPSGILVDTAGSASLMPVNIPQGSYALPVPGWTRHAVSTPELLGDHSYGTVATGNLDGTSYFVLLYVSVISVPPSPRAIAGIGNQGDHHYVTVTAGGTLGASYGPPSVDPSPSAGTVPLGTAVHPVVMEIDAMHMTFTAYTDMEKVSHAWVPTMGLGNLFVAGSASIGAGGFEYLYGALWQGPNAQLADADVRKLLESLGWTVTGY